MSSNVGALNQSSPGAIAPPSQSIILNLPEELIERIFANLRSFSDHRNVANICRLLNAKAITSASNAGAKTIKGFIEGVVLRLQTLNQPNAQTDNQRVLLSGLLRDLNLRGEYFNPSFGTFIELERYVSELKMRLIDILKTLDDDTIKDLEKQNPLTYFMKDIWSLAKIYREIDKANALEDNEERGYEFLNIARNLRNLGRFEQAFVIARRIPSLTVKEEALKTIFYSMIETKEFKSGKFQEALEIIDSLSLPNERDMLCIRLFINLKKSPQSKKWIELQDRVLGILLSSETSSPEVPERELHLICEGLIFTNQIEKAIQMALLKTKDKYEYTLLASITEKLTQSEGFGEKQLVETLKIACVIPEKEQRYTVLRELCKAAAACRGFTPFALKKELEQALDSCDHKKALASLYAFYAITQTEKFQSGQIEEAQKFAISLSQENNPPLPAACEREIQADLWIVLIKNTNPDLEGAFAPLNLNLRFTAKGDFLTKMRDVFLAMNEVLKEGVSKKEDYLEGLINTHEEEPGDAFIVWNRNLKIDYHNCYYVGPFLKETTRNLEVLRETLKIAEYDGNENRMKAIKKRIEELEAVKFPR